MYSADAGAALPRVSVLMPTFKQADYIRRALESLRAQTFADWELVVVDDGSPDRTAEVLEPYLVDDRVRYHRLEKNGGLGAALNLATRLARGAYLAYLPSDDLYYPDHLERLVGVLEARPEVHLAYGGVRWGWSLEGPTLYGEGPVGREAEALAAPLPPSPDEVLTAGSLFALVQVMHRRDSGLERPWPTRAEVVSNTLEADFWRGFVSRGAVMAYAGATTCEWVSQPDMGHRIIAGHPGGLSRYRRYYGVGTGEYLDFRPTHGMKVDERARYGRFDTRRALPAPGGLKILVVGSLGFNPERILAFEERGHKLYGLWWPYTETWDHAGPFGFGNIEDIPFDEHWRERVRAARPDVIYGLLNLQALGMVREVLEVLRGDGVDLPAVFHFKEGPFSHYPGVWPNLMRVLELTDGQVFISPENREFYELATDGLIDPSATMILDGDPPKLDWMTDDWAPKLSEADGQIHTVCAGRPIGLDPFSEIAAAGIHVHFYGDHFHQWFPNWSRAGVQSGFVHLHATVGPQDWTRELSRYDAGWVQHFTSNNAGDLRRARWDDLNLPARLGTYAAAGLPWIVRDNAPSRVAMQALAERFDIGVFFKSYPDLAQQLRDRPRLAELTANARASRPQFAFDTHTDDLVAFFRRTIDRHRRVGTRRAAALGEPAV